MAELATLARPYGNAAFSLAKKAAALARWSRLLSVLGAAVAEARVRSLIESPDLAGEVKAHRLAELCSDEIDDLGRRFLQVLADHGRLPLLAEVHRRFEVLRAAEERKLDVEVQSARPLTEGQQEALKTALKARFDKEVMLSSIIDESLLGGTVIRAGDMVIDGSARGRLNRLAESLARV